jgi:hypothetical protein
MFELLWFFKGAVSVSDYESMSWSRRETAFRWMQEVRKQQAKQQKRGRRG